MPSTTLEHLRPDQICDEPPALFALGNVVATPAALALIQEHSASVPQLLNRHQTGDWQELCEQDRDANWQAVFTGERVLSAFNLGSADRPAKIWVISEEHQPVQMYSVTTILLPDDY
jgi:hypothetical protein